MLVDKIQTKKFCIPSGGSSLASVLTIESPAAPLVVLAHGFAGNKNENGLFVQAAEYFSRNGLSTLRFDFSACGENGGKFKTVRIHDLVADLQSVFFYIKSNPSLRSLPIGFVGFSLGAGIGLLSGVPIDSYVFWSPAIYTRTDMVPRYEEELDRKGFVIKGNVKISKGFIDDLDSDAIPNSLSGLTNPVLLIHGSADQRIPHASSMRAFGVLRQASCQSKLVIIPGADHSYRTDPAMRERVLAISSDWLRTHLEHDGEARSESIGSERALA
jgi:alpha-beta hydrolase superfamily lysophospholipase